MKQFLVLLLILGSVGLKGMEVFAHVLSHMASPLCVEVPPPPFISNFFYFICIFSRFANESDPLAKFLLSHGLPWSVIFKQKYIQLSSWGSFQNKVRTSLRWAAVSEPGRGFFKIIDENYYYPEGGSLFLL